MTSTMDPQKLKRMLTGGLLAFPVTDFDEDGELDRAGYKSRLEWMRTFSFTALFPAGGGGEFFSLTLEELEKVLHTAIGVFKGKIPICAPAGQGTRQAIVHVQMAERLGADGILLFPPYLVETPQRGLIEHITAICEATALGVVVYNRANCRLHADSLIELSERCPNLISVKDGSGDFEALFKMRSAIGDRLLIVNGMPTAEVYAEAYRGLGSNTYSSALLNFLPELSIDFHRAIVEEDEDFVGQVTREFLTPYVALRNREQGYAVSIVKAGVEVIGRGSGSVRPPLAPLTPEQVIVLTQLVQRAQAIRPRSAEDQPAARNGQAIQNRAVQEIA